MQQDSLIATTDPKSGAGLFARESSDIAQHYDLALTRWKIAEGSVENRVKAALDRSWPRPAIVQGIGHRPARRSGRGRQPAEFDRQYSLLSRASRPLG